MCGHPTRLPGRGSAAGCSRRGCWTAGRTALRWSPGRNIPGMDHSSLKGNLLIAAPTLLDPNFRRTVVLLLEHTPDGAIGVVLNRPSDTEAREAVPDLRAVLLDDEPIFLGGPVQAEAGGGGGGSRSFSAGRCSRRR